MFTRDNQVYYQDTIIELDELNTGELERLRGEMLASTKGIEEQLEFESSYRDDDWERRAKNARKHMIIDLGKIDKFLRCAESEEKEVTISGDGLQFEIKDYQKEKVYDEVLANEIAKRLTSLQKGQVAEAVVARSEVKEIRAVMPRVAELLHWRKQTNKSKVYRTIDQALPGGQARLKIFRY